MGKFYAVKFGRKTGIYTSWAECEQQVKGFKGASYKSFTTKEEAQQFLSVIDSSKQIIEKNELQIYVDGSYSKTLKKAGFGCVFVKNDSVIHTVAKDAPIDSDEDLWNVTAEIAGVLYAVEWALNNKYPVVNIFYDYEGLEKWYSGEWKTKKKTTKNYVSKLNQFKKDIYIKFNKVKAHSGDTFNELADELAKSAVEGNIKEIISDEIHANSDIEILKLTEFHGITGDASVDKIKIKYKDLTINESSIIKIAKYIWKKEKRKISDLEIEGCFDMTTFILDLNLSDKNSNYKINKKIKIEGE